MHIKQGHPDKAARALSKLRRLPPDDAAIQEELAEIIANHEYELSLGKATYLDCFRGNLGYRLATGCLLQSLQQLTGVNFIFYYGASFFQNSGIANGFTTSMITNGVNVASTFPGLYMVEKWGRRPLLLMGAIGMASKSSKLLISTLADLSQHVNSSLLPLVRPSLLPMLQHKRS